jgi:hypothetical protein
MGHAAKRTFLTQKTKGTEEVFVSLKPPFFGKRRILKGDKYIIFIISCYAPQAKKPTKYSLFFNPAGV